MRKSSEGGLTVNAGRKLQQKVSLDPSTHLPALTRDNSQEIVFTNPLAMLHVSVNEMDREDDTTALDALVNKVSASAASSLVSSPLTPSPASLGPIPPHLKATGSQEYTAAEIKLLEKMRITDDSDEEDDQSHLSGASMEAFKMREQELALYRDLFLQHRESSVNELDSVESPEPSPQSTPSQSPDVRRKITFQAAARAVIAGNRFVEALTLDIEQKRASSSAKAAEAVESLDIGSKTKTLSKSKTIKSKQRHSLFGVTSHFIAAYKNSKASEDVETIEESKRKIISVGSVPALVSALTTSSELDMEFALEFLATHRFFTTSIKLLQHFINQHNAPVGQGTREDNKLREGTQVHVLKVIRYWLTRHPQDFGPDSIIERSLLSFLRLDVPDGPLHQAEVDSILAIIDEKNIQAKQAAAAAAAAPLSPPPAASTLPPPSAATSRKLSSKLSNVLLSADTLQNVDAEVVGEQLALLETGLFKAVTDQELFNYIKQNKKVTPNLTAIMNWSNLVLSWIARVIVLAEDPKLRVETLKYFIKVAKYCLQIKSYNTVFEVVEALSLTPIQRLTKTWRSLPTKYKASWLELVDVVSPADNFLVYRELLRNSKGSELPSFSIYLRDIDSAMFGMPTETPDSRINFYKFHVIGGALISLAYAQAHQGKFIIAPNEDLQSQLKNFPSLSLTDSFVARAREVEAQKNGLFGIDLTAQIGAGGPEPMFGIDLTEATDKFGVFVDTFRGMVPIIVRELVKCFTDEKLSTEGIFRRSGNQGNMQRMKKEIDATGKLDCLKTATPLDLSGLMGHYFKELPDPLFTGRLYKKFLAISSQFLFLLLSRARG